MWIVLTDDLDPMGPWIARGLRRRGLVPSHAITGTDLALARSWEQRLDDAGTGSRIELAGGLCLESGAIRGVVNRLQRIPDAFGIGLKPADQAYAQQEAAALLLSWIHSLPCPVINPAAANGLSGSWRHPLEWWALARRAGLPVPDYRLDADAPLIAAVQPAVGLAVHLRRLAVVEYLVVGGELIGPPSAPRPPVRVARAAVDLSHRAGIPLLGIQLAPRSRPEWMFLGASLLADLRPAGEPVLDALTHLLRCPGIARPDGAPGSPVPQPDPRGRNTRVTRRRSRRRSVVAHPDSPPDPVTGPTPIPTVS